MRARSRVAVVLGSSHGQYGPRHILGSNDGAREPWSDGDVVSVLRGRAVSIRIWRDCSVLDMSEGVVHTPASADLAHGNRSAKRSSDSTPTSPFIRSSSRIRAEMAGRSRRLLRRLFRGWSAPFCTSMIDTQTNSALRAVYD